ncbi:phage tail protein [Flavihumibacter sp. R14]|nr:phage tail protein [Flavihumibacter soli]
MDLPYLAEIMIVSFNFPPRGWAMCNGQFLPINQNQALFSLLGTTYGGNGQTTFALPNLRGRAPIHMGNGHDLGEAAGQTAHTVTISELPAHNHEIQKPATGFVNAKAKIGTTANMTTPEGNYFAGNTAETKRFSNRSDSSLGNGVPTVGSVGGSQPHNNMQPYLVLNYVIALQGVFPTR